MQVGPMVSAASANARTMRFRPSRPQRHTVSAAEEVAVVASGAATAIQRFRINPADGVTFPYLSVQARQWEFYRFKKLRFFYLTRSATSEAGSVILSPDYDNKDAPAATEIELVNTKDATNGVIWADLECKLDPRMMYSQGPRKKVSDTLMFDRDLYDSGVLRLLARSPNTLATAGILWVEYEVDFEVPAEPEDVDVGEEFLNVFAINAGQALTSGVSATVLWSTIAGVQQGLSYSAGVFTATAKCRFRIILTARCQGSTTASDFIAIINIVTTGSALGVSSAEANGGTTGAHQASLATQFLVDLDVGETFSAAIQVTASTDPSLTSATLTAEPY